MFLNLSIGPKAPNFGETGMSPLHHFMVSRSYYSDQAEYGFGYVKCFALPLGHSYASGQIDFEILNGKNLCVFPL